MPAEFQTFDDRSEPAASARRIEALRHGMAAAKLDGFIVPTADEHQSEYRAPCAERLFWLLGFTGSAGNAVVLKDKVGLIVDGRYTVQAAQQTDAAVVTVVRMADQTMEAWLAAHAPKGGRIGYDPWLHTPEQVKALKEAAAKAGAQMIAVPGNPVDAIWNERPPAPQGAVTLHPAAYAGEDAAHKLDRVRAALQRERCAGLLISDPHNLAWLFNIRGADISHTPLAFGYAFVPAQGRPRLYLDEGKLDGGKPGPVRQALAPLADFAEPRRLTADLRAQASGGDRLRFDRSTVSDALVEAWRDGGGEADIGLDPISLMKAVKNAAEQQGSREAHLRDGAAVARFLAWLEREAPSGGVTEIDTVERLEEERRATGRLKNVSFPSISGAGPNAALPHYRVNRASNRTLEPGIFLIDSGAQYEDGTTDITRTVAVGAASAEMKDRFTRVLKGHIAIDTAVFPKGTSGAQLDSFARQPLWEAGLDFDHGTGHGIGSYLSVHEGPQRIAKTGTTPLEPGMLLSNEPGYYKEGAYGIRIENLILVEKRDIPGAERDMYGFETLTFTPIDLNLVEPSLLTAKERDWLNAYHLKVREKIGPLVEGETAAWLHEATRPL